MRSNSPISHQINSGISSCEIHIGYIVTHFCCLPTCLIALCSKCIKDHNQFHKNEGTYSEIELIDDVKEYCHARIKASISNYTKELERLNSNTKNIKGKINENDFNEEIFANIKKSKVLLFEIIHTFYQ